MRILITGEGSYVGKSFEAWLAKYPKQYRIETISVCNDSWEKISFRPFDVVFHVAGIAHVSSNSKLHDLYFKVNRDLTIAVAKKAKADGVRQFIFMSSIIVYGNQKLIEKNTEPRPRNFYGRSKLEAENGIMCLQDQGFNVVIIRAPMIYGRGSKGNYPKLVKATRILPVFPDIDNQRSMLYIDNLCEFVKAMIDNDEKGVFFPQNKEYVKTSEMVRLIAQASGKHIVFVPVHNFIVKFLARFFPFLNKIFGDFVYAKEISCYRTEYRVADFAASIMEEGL